MEQGWVSSCYGEKKEAPILAFSVHANCSEDLVTFLLPQVTGASPKPTVREIEALEGRAFEICGGGKHDILMLRGFPGETAGASKRRDVQIRVTWPVFSERARMPLSRADRRQPWKLKGENMRSGTRIDYLAVAAWRHVVSRGRSIL